MAGESEPNNDGEHVQRVAELAPFTLKASGDDPRELVSPVYDLPRAPCFRESMLWGIGSGFGVSVAHFAVNRRLPRATNLGLGAFGLVSCSMWLVCRQQYKERRRTIKEALEKGTSKVVMKYAMPDDPRLAKLSTSLGGDEKRAAQANPGEGSPGSE